MARIKKIDLAKSRSKKKASAVKSAPRKIIKVLAKKKAVVAKVLTNKTAKIPVKKKKLPAKALVSKKIKDSVKKKTAKAVVMDPKRKVSHPVVPQPAVRKSKRVKAESPKISSSLAAADVKAVPQKARRVRAPKITANSKARVTTLSGIQAVQPVSQPFFQEVLGILPAGYGDHFISLMICSPYQLYTYWEIQKPREAEALQILGGGWDQVRSILRVYNLTQNPKGSLFVDLELGGGVDRWFISVEPDQSYRVEIGLRHADGRFIMLARSNDVITPRVTMSEVLDEEWMGIDFERMYALSGGFSEAGQHPSSVTLQRLMSERLRSGDTSGSGAGMLSSGSMVKKKDRNFWFTLNCELIVYGATAPNAQVTMNGQAVQLRPDGTFTLRYPLPDGKIRLEAKAVSADLVEERTITPTVQRNTERPEPVIRRNRGRG